MWQQIIFDGNNVLADLPCERIFSKNDKILRFREKKSIKDWSKENNISHDMLFFIFY